MAAPAPARAGAAGMHPRATPPSAAGLSVCRGRVGAEGARLGRAARNGASGESAAAGGTACKGYEYSGGNLARAGGRISTTAVGGGRLEAVRDPPVVLGVVGGGVDEVVRPDEDATQRKNWLIGRAPVEIVIWGIL